jgi:hypothetical protein
MPFPNGWPPPVASAMRSLRFFASGTATANYDDNAFLFASGAGANPYTPLPYVAPGGEKTQVDIGKNPQGTGADPHDVDPSYPYPPADTPPPVPAIYSQGICIVADGGDIKYSFDGVNDAGEVKAADLPHFYWGRHEAGIAIKGSGNFRVIAW